MAGNRLSALDASFLHIESTVAHMHVASVLIFEGDPPLTVSGPLGIVVRAWEPGGVGNGCLPPVA
jgi:hypothetical protein